MVVREVGKGWLPLGTPVGAKSYNTQEGCGSQSRTKQEKEGKDTAKGLANSRPGWAPREPLELPPTMPSPASTLPAAAASWDKSHNSCTKQQGGAGWCQTFPGPATSLSLSHTQSPGPNSVPLARLSAHAPHAQVPGQMLTSQMKLQQGMEKAEAKTDRRPAPGPLYTAQSR